MPSDTFKQELIRLGASNPDLRPAIRKVLAAQQKSASLNVFMDIGGRETFVSDLSELSKTQEVIYNVASRFHKADLFLGSGEDFAVDIQKSRPVQFEYSNGYFEWSDEDERHRGSLKDALRSLSNRR